MKNLLRCTILVLLISIASYAVAAPVEPSRRLWDGTHIAAVTASSALKTDASATTQPVAGDVASGASDTGNPVSIGGRAATTTNPTAVTDGQRVKLMATKEGVKVVTGNKPRALRVESGVVTVTTTGETTLIAAGAAGIFHDLEWIKCSNTSATATRLDIRDATAGTVIDALYLPAGDIRGAVYGITPMNQTTAANNWTIQLSGAVTDVRCTAKLLRISGKCLLIPLLLLLLVPRESSAAALNWVGFRV